MKIVFLARLFYPHIGGVEKHTYEVSKRLIALKHKVVVITEKHEESLKNKEVFESIEIYRISLKNKGWFKKLDIWIWIWKNRNLIITADLIHCHDVFFWYLPFRFLLPQKKIFTTFHGYESYPVSKKAIFVRKISEILSRGNICIGAFMKKWYYSNPDFISYGATSMSLKKKAKVKNNSAVFIGRLDEQTGILIYFQAVNYLKKKIKNFSFTIVGDGIYKSLVNAKYNVTGFKKDAMNYLFQNNFAFVSRYLSILEAMMAKKLIFAVYDNPIKEDYLKMTPFSNWIIIEHNPEKLAQKIQYFLKNPDEKKKKISKAYEWVLTQTWVKMTDTYLKLWQKDNK